jgi:hypothetical protein
MAKRAPVDPATVTFAFEDLERRTFVVLNRAGDGYHLIAPVRDDDPRCQPRLVDDSLDDAGYADPLLRPGDLGCTCRGGTYHGSCYALVAATLRLSVDFGEVPGWDGAGASVEAARG